MVDYLDAAVDLTTLYNPEALPDGVRSQVDVLDRCAALTAENEADQVYRRLLQYLFSGAHDPSR